MLETKQFSHGLSMKTILVMGLLTLSTSAFSSVVKSYDSKKGCNLYSVVSDTKKAKQAGETVVYDKAVYGLAIEDMDVDFDNREVTVQVVMNIVMGINRNIGTKSIIEESNPQFKMLVNQVNRKISMFEKVCISQDARLIYAKIMETK